MQAATPMRGSSGWQFSPIAWLAEDTLAGIARRRALLGYLFVLPTVLGILIFTAGPVVVSLGLSFFKWNVFQPAEYVGFVNYRRLFNDLRVFISFVNTLKFVLLAVALQIAVSLSIALAVSQRMATWLRYYFRTAFFLPLLMSGAATGVVLGYMLHREFGVVNYYLGLLGIPRIPWLNSSNWVLYTMVLAYVWQNMGFTLVLFIGGLNNIPPEILDAADVDGATGWRRLWHVILPLLSPTMLFALVTGIIGGLQIFDIPYVMTRGGPGDASRTAVMVMYESAFKNMEVGYGSSVAVILFILIMLVTAMQFWLSKRWVFYQ
ncbi:MAG: sugar ABC transporter permease [Anaerolineae bacterium]|nr:sugar ABC transporter permease [Anaerolineae bacterium]